MYVSYNIANAIEQLTDVDKFVGKSKYVGLQISVEVYQSVDPQNPALLLLLIPFVGIVLIRIENERIRFYDIRRILSLGLFMILLTSTVLTPFSYSLVYWGHAFAEEPPQNLGPPNGTAADEFAKRVHVLLDGKTSIEQANEQLNKEIKDILINKTSIPPPFQNTTTVELTSETMVMPPKNTAIKLSEKLIGLDHTELDIADSSDNYPKEYLEFSDNLSLRLNNVTIPTRPSLADGLFQLATASRISDSIISLFNNGTVIPPPNATESWQFENDTSDVTLQGDATIIESEGINGTSLLLDGDLDFAETLPTNATTYLTDMAISAWVKPDYSQGSPEFTVVSKGNSFVLSINNLWEPQKIAKFSIFDGIKWTTVESTSTIPEGSWSHLTARFNKTAIEIYVNGTREGIVSHDGIPFVNARGQIELKTLEEITSYSDIVIGASITPNMKSSAYNMFSGLIDGVELFDHQLEPSDVANLYSQTIPIKRTITEVQTTIGIPPAVLNYRALNVTEIIQSPHSITSEELNSDLKQLTVSTWVKPDYTNGSPEFTIVGKENSFAASINKISQPEKVAKFSVYDGISWHTVTGSTPIESWTHVAGVLAGSEILIYVNGTREGILDTGSQNIAGTASDVIIGAYQSISRGQIKQNNFFAGSIDEVTIYKFTASDSQIKEEFLEQLSRYTGIYSKTYDVEITDSAFTSEPLGIQEKLVEKADDANPPFQANLGITDKISILINGKPIELPVTPELNSLKNSFEITEL
jgi:hypothetical protein